MIDPLTVLNALFLFFNLCVALVNLSLSKRNAMAAAQIAAFAKQVSSAAQVNLANAIGIQLAAEVLSGEQPLPYGVERRTK